MKPSSPAVRPGCPVRPQVYRQMDPNATDSEEERCEEEDLTKLKARPQEIYAPHSHTAQQAILALTSSLRVLSRISCSQRRE